MAYLVGWSCRLNWLKSSLFKTWLFPSISHILIPIYCTCYWSPERLFDSQECIVVRLVSAYRIYTTQRSLFRDTSTDLPFATVGVHRENSNLKGINLWKQKATEKLFPCNLVENKPCLSGLTLAVEVFWQGPWFFWFSWIWRRLPQSQYLEEITWKYCFKLSIRATSLCLFDSFRDTSFSHQLPRKRSLLWRRYLNCLRAFSPWWHIDDCKQAQVGHFVSGLNLSMVHRLLLQNLTDFHYYVDMAFKVQLVLLALSTLLTSGTERSKEVSTRGRRLCLCSDRVLRLSSQDSEVSRDIAPHVPIGK